ncbi:MAG: MFS transporter [Chloroflexota bacterium]|jgi:MFS family permease
MNEYIDLLRNNRNYRNLWLGSVITQLGDWFNLIASAERLTQITDTGTAVSALFLARFLPLFLFSPLAGVIADKYDRKQIMVFTDVLRAFIVLGFLFVREPQHVWLLYGLTVFQFSMSALFTPARTAVLANIVRPDELVKANALDSLTWSTMLALGAFLGGVVAAIFGADTAFVMDAFTFLLSAWVLSRIQITVERDVALGSGWLELFEGLGYLWREPLLLMIVLAKAVGSLVWGGINVLEISFAHEVFPLHVPAWQQTLNIENAGTAALGVIYVMTGLGTGLGPILIRYWLKDVPQRMLWTISASMGLMVGGIFVIGLAPTFSLFLLGTLIRTVGTGAVWVFSAALLHLLVPDRYRGRVFAFEFAMLTLTQSISILAAGLLQDTAGWHVSQVTLVIATCGVVVFAIWMTLHLVNRTALERRVAQAPI